MEIYDVAKLKMSPFYASESSIQQRSTDNSFPSCYNYPQIHDQVYRDVGVPDAANSYRRPINITSATFAMNQASQLLPASAWSVSPPLVEKQLQDTSFDKLSDNETISQWDINDQKLPTVCKFDQFQLWPQGSSRLVYQRLSSDSVRRHTSGWAMRNTNNHNSQILKKSCLGVLMCSETACNISLRPAICDKARRSQEGRPCLRQGCTGVILPRACRGHGGYPVTHFWREVGETVYFQSKGYHDHARPDVKPIRCNKANRVACATSKTLTTISSQDKMCSEVKQPQQSNCHQMLKRRQHYQMDPPAYLTQFLPSSSKRQYISPEAAIKFANFHSAYAGGYQQAEQTYKYSYPVDDLSNEFRPHWSSSYASAYSYHFPTTEIKSMKTEEGEMEKHPSLHTPIAVKTPCVNNLQYYSSSQQASGSASGQNVSWSTPSPPTNGSSSLFSVEPSLEVPPSHEWSHQAFRYNANSNSNYHHHPQQLHNLSTVSMQSSTPISEGRDFSLPKVAHSLDSDRRSFQPIRFSFDSSGSRSSNESCGQVVGHHFLPP